MALLIIFMMILVPVAPTQDEMIYTNSTHLVLHLSMWQGDGCPITRMSVEYKSHSHNRWTVLTDHVNPEQQHQLVVPDVAPETWYVVKVVAYNAAGSSTAKYDVITLTNNNGKGCFDEILYVFKYPIVELKTVFLVLLAENIYIFYKVYNNCRPQIIVCFKNNVKS